MIDMDAKIQGTYIDRYHLVTDFKSALKDGVSVCFIMNQVHYADNFALLRENGFSGKIIDMDELVENRTDVDLIIEGKPYTVGDRVDFDLDELHRRVLVILDEIERICKKHELTYFLSAGTALGAVRHKGFVPWDDDADIGMPRKDFEKFRKIAEEELGKGFYYQTMRKDNDFTRSFDQVGLVDSAFVLKHDKNMKIHHGIHVDVFPFDKVSGDSALREEHVKQVRDYRMQLYKMRFKVDYASRNPWKNFMVNFYYYTGKLKSYQKLYKKMERTLTKYDGDDTGYVADLLTHYKKIMYFKEEDIYPVIYVDFEDRKYPIPKNYDEYLKMMYGDYMTPPPEGKRNCRNQILYVSCTKAFPPDLLSGERK